MRTRTGRGGREGRRRGLTIEPPARLRPMRDTADEQMFWLRWAWVLR